MSIEMNLLRREVLGDGIRRDTSRYPDKEALIYYYIDGRTVSYTYKELNAKVNRVATGLLDLGVKKGIG